MVIIMSMTIAVRIAMFITMSTGSETANLRFIEGPYNAI